MFLLFIIGFGIPIGVVAYMIHVGFVRKRQAFGSVSPSGEEVVILKMHGAAIEGRYQTGPELQNLVDRLQWAMGDIGEVRDVDVAEGTVTITIFGESADAIYSDIRKILRHNPFSKNASVVRRYGPPGSRERRTHMAH